MKVVRPPDMNRMSSSYALRVHPHQYYRVHSGQHCVCTPSSRPSATCATKVVPLELSSHPPEPLLGPMSLLRTLSRYAASSTGTACPYALSGTAIAYLEEFVHRDWVQVHEAAPYRPDQHRLERDPARTIERDPARSVERDPARSVLDIA
eukprot:793497-Rhodomonas_salina.4